MPAQTTADMIGTPATQTTERGMNPLQRLIQDWLDTRRGEETYTTLATRGGINKQTISEIVGRTTPYRQMIRSSTITGLARGMELDEEIVREAARLSVGSARFAEVRDHRMRVLMEFAGPLDEDRFEYLMRRAQQQFRDQRAEDEGR